MTRRNIIFLGILAVMGAGWGITQPLTKIAVSTGYRNFGLIFWQLALGAVALAIVRSFAVTRNDRRQFVCLRLPTLRKDPPALLVYVVIALIGTILPNSATYEAIRHLPSGLISILLSLVPMFAFPIALLMRNEQFAPMRLGGLLFGLLGVLLIVAPEASLPDRAMLVFVPLALVAPLFYGLEGNAVAKWGTAGLAPIDVLYGASFFGATITLPLALASGEFINPLRPWGAPEFALLASSLIHVAVYTTYVWMVGATGPVFAVQVSYLVTGFGVIWAMILLGESYSAWIWAAMALILVGVFLVQPRSREVLADTEETGKMPSR